MAEGIFNSAWEGTKNLAASAADATTNAAKSGREGVRSFMEDIALDPDDIALLETHTGLQLGAEVLDGKLSPDDQKKLIQKILLIKAKRDIDKLLSDIKTTRLRSLVKTYAFPEREEGTELHPSTTGDDVGTFVESSFGAVKAIGQGAINMSAWGNTPDERIENLQAEVFIQAKRTRLAVHNMIAESPEWLQFGSPSHDSSGWADPYLFWNSIRDEDARTSSGQEEIAYNTPEHKLDYLESIIDTLVAAARNPKNLDANLTPKDASISLKSTSVGTTERKFGSDYENELLFTLQYLQAMEEGANAKNRGLFMSLLKYHVTDTGKALTIDALLLITLAVGVVKIGGGMFKDGAKALAAKKVPFIGRIPLIGPAIDLADKWMSSKAAKLVPEGISADSEAKMETVEGVKIPEKAAELAKNALKKLRETPLTDATFEHVELHPDGSATPHTNIPLDDPERIKRINYIKAQLEEFGKGKITEMSLIENISKGYNGSYIYDKALRGVDVGNMIPSTGPARTVLRDPSIGRFKKAVKLPSAIISGVFGGAVGEAGTIGTNLAERLARRTVEKTGLGGNLEAERTAKALANADKLEPYKFGDSEWNLNDGTGDTKKLLKELDPLLAQRDRLEEARKRLGKAKDRALELEGVSDDMAGIDSKLKTSNTTISGGRTVTSDGEIANSTHADLLAKKQAARSALGEALTHVRETNANVDGIAIDALNLKSSSHDIDIVLQSIETKMTNSSGLNKKILGLLKRIKTKNPSAVMPTFEDLRGKNLSDAMRELLHSLGKIKVEAKI